MSTALHNNNARIIQKFYVNVTKSRVFKTRKYSRNFENSRRIKQRGTEVLRKTVDEQMCENISDVFKMLFKYSIRSFSWTTINNISNQEKQATKQEENKKKTKKLVHMHTGNTKVRKFYISKYDRQEQITKLL